MKHELLSCSCIPSLIPIQIYSDQNTFGIIIYFEAGATFTSWLKQALDGLGVSVDTSYKETFAIFGTANTPSPGETALDITLGIFINGK